MRPWLGASCPQARGWRIARASHPVSKLVAPQGFATSQPQPDTHTHTTHPLQVSGGEPCATRPCAACLRSPIYTPQRAYPAWPRSAAAPTPPRAAPLPIEPSRPTCRLPPTRPQNLRPSVREIPHRAHARRAIPPTRPILHPSLLQPAAVLPSVEASHRHSLHRPAPRRSLPSLGTPAGQARPAQALNACTGGCTASSCVQKISVG
jgi:hypothetical protein